MISERRLIRELAPKGALCLRQALPMQSHQMRRLSLFAVTLLLVLAAIASAQNTAAAGPTAGVAEKITFTDVNIEGPFIAMTFDDGPHATDTAKLLDMAAKR